MPTEKGLNGKAKEKRVEERMTISAPDFKTVVFRIIGTAPYVQNKFSQRGPGFQAMKDAQLAGQSRRKGNAKKAKDFEALYDLAMHKSADGWCGIPAPAFRNAMISACKIVGFHMTKAKLMVFVEADGFDPIDGTPLVKITKGEPHYHEAAVRNESGVADIRPRPMWDPGWEAVVRVRFDNVMFSGEDVANLLMRAGMQVGVGEGRPDSRKSCGMGWGMFKLAEWEDAA